MNRFAQSNRNARDLLIDPRRPGIVKGGLVPVGRDGVDGLFSTPGR